MHFLLSWFGCTLLGPEQRGSEFQSWLWALLFECSCLSGFPHSLSGSSVFPTIKNMYTMLITSALDHGIDSRLDLVPFTWMQVKCRGRNPLWIEYIQNRDTSQFIVAVSCSFFKSISCLFYLLVSCLFIPVFTHELLIPGLYPFLTSDPKSGAIRPLSCQSFWTNRKGPITQTSAATFLLGSKASSPWMQPHEEDLQSSETTDRFCCKFSKGASGSCSVNWIFTKRYYHISKLRLSMNNKAQLVHKNFKSFSYHKPKR